MYKYFEKKGRVEDEVEVVKVSEGSVKGSRQDSKKP